MWGVGGLRYSRVPILLLSFLLLFFCRGSFPFFVIFVGHPWAFGISVALFLEGRGFPFVRWWVSLGLSLTLPSVSFARV